MKHYIVTGIPGKTATMDELRGMVARINTLTNAGITFSGPKRGVKSLIDIRSADGASLAVGNKGQIEYYLIGILEGILLSKEQG